MRTPPTMATRLTVDPTSMRTPQLAGLRMEALCPTRNDVKQACAASVRDCVQSARSRSLLFFFSVSVADRFDLIHAPVDETDLAHQLVRSEVVDPNFDRDLDVTVTVINDAAM